MNAPCLCSCIASSLGGDSAGINDYAVCLLWVGHDFVTLGEQLTADCFNLALVQAAANTIKINLHMIIVAQGADRDDPGCRYD